MGVRIGQPVRRREDLRLITGRGAYIDDLPFGRCRHAAVLRSPFAHARIHSVDTSAAQAMPGVDAVLTGRDVARLTNPIPVAVVDPPVYFPAAVDKVRFVGEPVVVVVAESRALAEDALESVVVDYDPLPAVMDPRAAVAPGAPVIHDGHSSNVAWHRIYRYGDVEADFGAADLVVAQDLSFPCYTTFPLETYGIVAEYEPQTGRYTISCNFQGPFTLHPVMARALGITADRLRLIVPPNSGGSFGIKAMIYPYVILMAVAARVTGSRVKWIEDRLESLRASSSSSDRACHLEAAVRLDGTLLALRTRVLENVGAYLRPPEPASVLRSLSNFQGAYHLSSLELDVSAVLTNKVPTGLNRGYGGPQHYFGLERLMDAIAARLGLDPAEVRSRNLIQPQEFPFRTITGGLYDSGNYPEGLRRALAVGRYEERRAEQARLRTDGRFLGLGLAVVVDSSTSNMGYIALAVPSEARAHPSYLDKSGAHETARIKMDPDGQVTVILSTAPQGQSHETVAAQVVEAELGLNQEQVRVENRTDTGASTWSVSSGSYSSRFAAMGATAVGLAARRLKQKLLTIAGELLEAAPADLEMADGLVRVKGSPDKRISLKRIAGLAHWNPEALPKDLEPGLEASATFRFPGLDSADPSDRINASGTYGLMVDLALVEVDTSTGAVRVLDYVSVHDAGTILNPLLVEGQRAGAALHGVSGALYEQLTYDSDGQLLTGSLMDYLSVTASEMPPLRLDHFETPSPATLYGAKGCGDGSCIPGPVAIANAVADALRPLGIEVNELPLPPDKVWRWVREAATTAGGEGHVARTGAL